MDNYFEITMNLINMGIIASVFILVIFMLRLVFKEIPRNIFCIMWGIVALCLIFPYKLSSYFSFYPQWNIEYTERSGFGPLYFGADAEPGNYLILPFDVKKPNLIVSSISYDIFDGSIEKPLLVISIVLYIGVAVALIHFAYSYYRTKKMLDEAINLRENIWACDSVETPYILGFINPRIYLPSGFDMDSADVVVIHEQTHIKNKDHIWKLLGYLLLSVYWWNPLVWLGYGAFCRDLEMACDERIIKDSSVEFRKNYANALLDCSTGTSKHFTFKAAFGEVDVKGRVENIVKNKKAKKAVVAIAIVICMFVSMGFATVPVGFQDVKPGEISFSEPVMTSEGWVIPAEIKKPGAFATYSGDLDGWTVSEDGGFVLNVHCYKRRSLNYGDHGRTKWNVKLDTEEWSFDDIVKVKYVCNGKSTEIWSRE